MQRKGKACDGVERIRSGINGLDQLLDGGFVKNSSILIRGDTGTAKTLFCLNYLYRGAKDYNEPGVYITFSEPQEAIFQHGRTFCWDIQGLVKENKFAIIRYEPHEVATIMNQGGGSIRDTIESIGAKRLVIDSLTTYEMVFESRYKVTESLLSLFELLRKWEVTTLVTSEYPVSLKNEGGGKLGFLTDGLINLYYARARNHKFRALEIIKMRDTVHDEKINRFAIEEDGIKVYRGIPNELE